MKKFRFSMLIGLFMIAFVFTSFAGPGGTEEIDVAKLRGDKEWVNPLATNADKQEADFTELVTTGRLEKEDRDDVLYFLNYVTYTKVLTHSDFGFWQKEPSVWVTTTKCEGPPHPGACRPTASLATLQVVEEWDARLVEMAESCRRETDLETLEALSKMLINMTTYDIEQKSAYSILTTGRGRCSASTQLFGNLCDRLGFEVEAITCWLKNRDTGEAELDKGHVFNRVKVDGVWHYYDVTNKDIDMTPEHMHKYWHFGDGTRSTWYWTKDKEKKQGQEQS